MLPGDPQRIQFRVLLPSEILIDEVAVKIIAEADNGAFCLLPRHIDFVAALIPGVLSYHTIDGVERFVGLDEGVLVKCAQQVTVSTLRAVQGADLLELRSLVEERFLTLNEQDRKARAALARLEAGTLRGFQKLMERSNG
ncbi:MAG: F0F1 ATP synthase subunit epsilon [Halioglobus sp.]|nr:F0F1 ATP synthase subunit epsilon [Halioglobus sp.]